MAQSVRHRLLKYKQSLEPSVERPRSELFYLQEQCNNSSIPVYEFNRWHRLRRGQVYSDLPLIVDSWQDLQTDWDKKFPGAPTGIEYAKGAIDKSGRVPEVITATIYDGRNYVHPGIGNPGKTYLKDMKIIEQLFDMGVENIMIGNAGPEIRFSHIESDSRFINQSLKFLNRIYKIWGSKLWVAIAHPDHYRDYMTGGKIAQWLAEHQVPDMIMCGYTWLFDKDHPVNAVWAPKREQDHPDYKLWRELYNNHLTEQMSEYIKKFTAGTGLAGRDGLYDNSLKKAEKYGHKFATVSFL